MTNKSVMTSFLSIKYLSICILLFQVTNKTCIPLSRMTKVRAKFINFGAVECELPEVRSYLIYISNNGRDKSEQPLVFVPFNSQCQHCSTIGSFCYPKLVRS